MKTADECPSRSFEAREGAIRVCQLVASIPQLLQNDVQSCAQCGLAVEIGAGGVYDGDGDGIYDGDGAAFKVRGRGDGGR